MKWRLAPSAKPTGAKKIAYWNVLKKMYLNINDYYLIALLTEVEFLRGR